MRAREADVSTNAQQEIIDLLLTETVKFILT